MRKALVRMAWVLLGAVLLANAIGCPGPPPPLPERLQSEEPGTRARAAVEAGRDGNPRNLPLLVELLDDPQDDVRMLAAVSLEHLTGRTMGYRWHDPPQQRAEAIRRWHEWLDAGQPADMPEP